MSPPRRHTRRIAIRQLLGSAAALAAWRAGSAADEKRLPRIGFMTGVDYPELEAAFTDELRKLGIVEGRDVLIERRLTRANSNDSVEMSAELANSALEFIVVSALPLALRVREANPRMPMIIGTCPGMVSNGFAKTLERPGGIYTGIDELPPGVTAKRLRLLKTAAPKVRRVALLSTTPGEGGHEAQVADAERAAKELDVTVKVYRATSLPELRTALDAIRADGMEGLQNFQGALSLMNRKMITDFAAENRMPAVYQARWFAESDGLMAWAPNQSDQLRIAAQQAAKVLAGASPGDLPVVYPPKYYLLLNTDAAERIGLTLPAKLLNQADRVIKADPYLRVLHSSDLPNWSPPS
jgi:putative ABC transport system substrate-binding protein